MDSACHTCRVGEEYQDKTGQNLCKPAPCPTGTYGKPATDPASPPECVRCPNGTFNAAIGLSKRGDCSPCPTGRWSDTRGATDIRLCTKCDEGKASPATGANVSSSCAACKPGRFQSSKGSAECQLCPAGKHGNLPGQLSEATGCTSCDAGKFNGLEGSPAEADCTQCPRGRWCATEGARTQGLCIMCEIGRAGKNAGANSSADCELCNSTGSGNQYQNLVGQTVCKTAACRAGKFGEGVKDEDCEECPLGKWSSSRGIIKVTECKACRLGTWGDTMGAGDSTACVECEKGKFGRYTGATDKSTCQDCALGKYSPFAGIDQGPESCLLCPAGRVASTSSSSSCAACPPHETSDEGSSSCECEPGYIRTTLSGDCYPCPDKLNCTKQGSTIANAKLQPNTWRASSIDRDWLTCPVDGTCIGGSDVNNYCLKGHHGPLCAICDHNYTRLQNTAPCSECPKNMGLAIFWTVLAVLGCCAALICFLAVNRKVRIQSTRA